MKLKVWLLAFFILIVVGIYMLTHVDAGLSMETSDGYEVTVAENDNMTMSIVAEFGRDFKHFTTIMGDLFHAIGGGSSRFDNGLAVLTGNEEIDLDTSEQTEDERDIGHKTGISTVAEQVAKQDDHSAVQLTEATVKRIVDGDTFYAAVGDIELKVRLIGVDTPESVHSDDSKNTVWGTYASDYTKSILKEDMTVYLEYDEEPTDKYGRTLAYVWLSADTTEVGNMLNAILVRDGYAYDKVFRPNVKYADLFEKLRISAQDSGAGLWADEGFAALWEG